MNLATLILIVYGVFSVSGGVIGYVKAKSLASLIAGSISGFVMLVCAYQITKGSRAAMLVGLIVALLLGIRFFRTWLRNHRFMPDLLMIVFSVATLIVVGLQIIQR